MRLTDLQQALNLFGKQKGVCAYLRRWVADMATRNSNVRQEHNIQKPRRWALLPTGERFDLTIDWAKDNRGLGKRLHIFGLLPAKDAKKYPKPREIDRIPKNRSVENMFI